MLRGWGGGIWHAAAMQAPSERAALASVLLPVPPCMRRAIPTETFSRSSPSCHSAWLTLSVPPGPLIIETRSTDLGARETRCPGCTLSIEDRTHDRIDGMCVAHIGRMGLAVALAGAGGEVEVGAGGMPIGPGDVVTVLGIGGHVDQRDEEPALRESTRSGGTHATGGSGDDGDGLIRGHRTRSYGPACIIGPVPEPADGRLGG